MLNQIDDLFNKYFNKLLSHDEFLNSISTLYSNDKDFIILGLNDAYDNHDSDNVGNYIYTLYVIDELLHDEDNNRYLMVLEKLLISDWHSSHEDIVALLEKISSLSSLSYLYDAINLKPDYLQWDDNYSFEKKCIHALAKIGKDKSIDYLSKLLDSNNPIISECAMKQLNKIQQSSVKSNEIRAVFNEETIRVYQAFNKDIVDEAISIGTFGHKFKMDRMTWIKPSFLWMMYRCGWASKDNQESVLAIDIKREGFEELLKYAVPSVYQEKKFGSQTYWKYKLDHSDVIMQWDPERDIYGDPLSIRSLQLGLRGEILKKYVNEWIVSISDITEYVKNLKEMIDNNQDINDLLPKEKIYISKVV